MRFLNLNIRKQSIKEAGYAILLFIIAAGVVGGSRLSRLNKADAIHPEGQTDLYLNELVGLQQLSHIVIDSLHLSNNKKQFIWAANLLGWQSFQPGHYQIDHNFTYNKFLEKLARAARIQFLLQLFRDSESIQ